MKAFSCMDICPHQCLQILVKDPFHFWVMNSFIKTPIGSSCLSCVVETKYCTYMVASQTQEPSGSMGICRDHQGPHYGFFSGATCRKYLDSYILNFQPQTLSPRFQSLIPKFQTLKVFSVGTCLGDPLPS